MRSVFGILHRLAAEAGDAAGEDHAGTSGCGAGGLEDIASAVEIDAQGIVEALLAFAADHRREMEDRDGGIGADGGEDGVAIADVARDLPHTRIGRGAMEDGVEQHDLADFFRGRRMGR